MSSTYFFLTSFKSKVPVAAPKISQLLLVDFPALQTSCGHHEQQPITTPDPLAGTYLMKPVSEVITSPGTTRSLRLKAEIDSDTGFRITGNLMSAAMLLPLLLLLLLFLVISKQLWKFYRHLLKKWSICCCFST